MDTLFDKMTRGHYCLRVRMTVGHLWVGKGQAMNSKEQEQTKIPDNTAAFEQFSQCLAAQRRAYHVNPVQIGRAHV